MSFIIETKDLTKVYDGRAVVDHLNFKVGEGELLSLLGPNGAGKTTTIKMLTTILKPNHGTASINNLDIQEERQKIREMISITPQELTFYEDLSAKENLLLFGTMYGIRKKLLIEEAENLLKHLGLVKEKERVKNFSGGMKRRLNFAIGIISNSKIFFLDEPTAGLDPQARYIIWNIIQNLKKRGNTIIMTTHDMHEADVLSDRVLIIDEGKIIAEGTPDELKDKYSEHVILEMKYKNDKGLLNMKEMLHGLNFIEEIKQIADRTFHIYFNGAIVNFIKILNKNIVNDVSELEYMRLRQNTLEDVFLKLTGRRLRK
ncbi:MAG: ABC transporter ATP-binding protein [Candidatus Hermodarchaeota archaeon]